MTQKKVLITGGTGLVGSRLTEILLQKGYKVAFLSRKPNPMAYIPTFGWDIEKKYIDEKAFEDVNFVVHLAGENVGEKSWSDTQKQQILNSRINSTLLLAQKIQDLEIPLESFVSASAIGYYGTDTGEKICDENTLPANDFLANVTKEWENAVFFLKNLEINYIVLRIGVVLSPKGGALPKLTQPIRWGAGASLGTGKQFLSWIHIDDLCEMIIFSMEKKLLGVYNAVAPNPVRNEEMTKMIAKTLKKPLILPNVPSFVLNLMLGEFSKSVLGGSNISVNKMLNEGFSFKYPTLEPALKNLLLS